MKIGAMAMSDQSSNRATNADAEIEDLARETDMPLELVQSIYSSEKAKLERTARIKIYVPVLIHRNVKALLREQRASL
jgi:Protein of unknown function (DUF3562)